MKINKILYIILALGILVASITASKRVVAEANNKTVDVVLEYLEFQELAKQSEEDLVWWFSEFKELGVRYVALPEESLFSLQREGRPLEIQMGKNLMAEVNWREKYPRPLVHYIDENGIGDYDVIAFTDSAETFSFISEGLSKRYPKDRFTLLDGEEFGAVIIPGTINDALYLQGINSIDTDGKTFRTEKKLYSSKLTRLSLGLDPEKVKTIEESGLGVLPRPYNYKGWIDERFVRTTLDEYEAYGIKPEVFIFDGDRVLGYPEEINLTTDYMRENNIKVALIETSVQREHLKQEGLIPLTEALNYNAVRVFSVWEYIQERFKYYGYEGAEEIENTLYRAVTERNIRLIYFKPFKEDKTLYITDINEYKKMFQRFEGRIANHGMELGSSSTLPPVKVRIRYMLIMGYGIVAAAILLLKSLVVLCKKLEIALIALGIIGVTGVLFVMPSMADKLLALAAGIVFASLGVVYYCRRNKVYEDNLNSRPPLSKTLLTALKDFIITLLIAGIGALFIGAILSDVKYLLELDIFRGVKISQILPMGMYIFIYLAYFGYKRRDKNTQPQLRFHELKALLLENIKLIHIFIGAVIAVVGVIYISRTGHETNIQPSTFEIMMRNLLEENLLARPRNKEFLIGFPALLIGFCCGQRGYRKLALVSGLAATIGLASMINTFSHLRTPLYLSFIRTIYAAGIGVALGIVGFVLLERLVVALNRYNSTR